GVAHVARRGQRGSVCVRVVPGVWNDRRWVERLVHGHVADRLAAPDSRFHCRNAGGWLQLDADLDHVPRVRLKNPADDTREGATGKKNVAFDCNGGSQSDYPGQPGSRSNYINTATERAALTSSNFPAEQQAFSARFRGAVHDV